MEDYHIRNYALEMLRDLRVITIRKEYLPDRKALHPDEKLFEKYPEFEEDTAMNVMLSFCIQGSYHAYQKNRSGDIMTVIDVIVGMTGAVRPMYEERLGESRS